MAKAFDSLKKYENNNDYQINKVEVNYLNSQNLIGQN